MVSLKHRTLLVAALLATIALLGSEVHAQEDKEDFSTSK
jgi:hypothetical protein